MLDKKRAILAEMIKLLEEQIEILNKSAASAHDEATHADTKQEGKYDTRAIEASYLAGAQYERARQMSTNTSILKSLPLRTFNPDEPIDVGAIVNLKNPRKSACYFILPKVSGLIIDWHGQTITSLTPESQIGDQLLDQFQGDYIDLETPQGTQKYLIESVY